MGTFLEALGPARPLALGPGRPPGRVPGHARTGAVGALRVDPSVVVPPSVPRPVPVVANVVLVHHAAGPDALLLLPSPTGQVGDVRETRPRVVATDGDDAVRAVVLPDDPAPDDSARCQFRTRLLFSSKGQVALSTKKHRRITVDT